MQAAASRQLDFILGLYADPVFLGDYPQSVKDRVPSLPPLTDQEKATLKGSADYFALNHYTTQYVKNDPSSGSQEGTGVTYTSSAGDAIGEQADSSWLYVVPWGFRYLCCCSQLLKRAQINAMHQPEAVQLLQ